jgi:hypothetical protein
MTVGGSRNGGLNESGHNSPESNRRSTLITEPYTNRMNGRPKANGPQYKSVSTLKLLAESTLVADGRINDLVNNALGYFEKVSLLDRTL